MAKGKKKPSGGDYGYNRQARFRYELLDRLECGIALLGTEVKALRTHGVQMSDAYVDVRRGELWIRNLRIDPYAPAAMNNHVPDRPRKLLAHRREIDKLLGDANQDGLTVIPTRIYPKGRTIKVEIALARGKNVADKRQDIKKRDQQREMQRALRERNR
ncbi:tmRNA-binding protein SmpB [Patulibacter medicamentivorans]|uniref:SsrA-binding protein n=1 Tax=Patulibacter medicamentivorans TaxID=1097667 RepID=H0E3C6_9ACTN|nr:SsrA-binding protein SmpB [Patulibacter medicamentivorans]EHN11810.1 tmRNA-binding protein SmpB [Patulibacter medicamentivorans]